VRAKHALLLLQHDMEQCHTAQMQGSPPQVQLAIALDAVVQLHERHAELCARLLAAEKARSARWEARACLFSKQSIRQAMKRFARGASAHMNRIIHRNPFASDLPTDTFKALHDLLLGPLRAIVSAASTTQNTKALRGAEASVAAGSQAPSDGPKHRARLARTKLNLGSACMLWMANIASLRNGQERGVGGISLAFGLLLKAYAAPSSLLSLLSSLRMSCGPKAVMRHMGSCGERLLHLARTHFGIANLTGGMVCIAVIFYDNGQVNVASGAVSAAKAASHMFSFTAMIVLSLYLRAQGQQCTLSEEAPTHICHDIDASGEPTIYHAQFVVCPPGTAVPMEGSCPFTQTPTMRWRAEFAGPRMQMISVAGASTFDLLAAAAGSASVARVMGWSPEQARLVKDMLTERLTCSPNVRAKGNWGHQTMRDAYVQHVVLDGQYRVLSRAAYSHGGLLMMKEVHSAFHPGNKDPNPLRFPVPWRRDPLREAHKTTPDPRRGGPFQSLDADETTRWGNCSILAALVDMLLVVPTGSIIGGDLLTLTNGQPALIGMLSSYLAGVFTPAEQVIARTRASALLSLRWTYGMLHFWFSMVASILRILDPLGLHRLAAACNVRDCRAGSPGQQYEKKLLLLRVFSTASALAMLRALAAHMAATGATFPAPPHAPALQVGCSICRDTRRTSDCAAPRVLAPPHAASAHPAALMSTPTFPSLWRLLEQGTDKHDYSSAPGHHMARYVHEYFTTGAAQHDQLLQSHYTVFCLVAKLEMAQTAFEDGDNEVLELALLSWVGVFAAFAMAHYKYHTLAMEVAKWMESPLWVSVIRRSLGCSSTRDPTKRVPNDQLNEWTVRDTKEQISNQWSVRSAIKLMRMVSGGLSALANVRSYFRRGPATAAYAAQGVHEESAMKSTVQLIFRHLVDASVFVAHPGRFAYDTFRLAECTTQCDLVGPAMILRVQTVRVVRCPITGLWAIAPAQGSAACPALAPGNVIIAAAYIHVQQATGTIQPGAQEPLTLTDLPCPPSTDAPDRLLGEVLAAALGQCDPSLHLRLRFANLSARASPKHPTSTKLPRAAAAPTRAVPSATYDLDARTQAAQSTSKGVSAEWRRLEGIDKKMQSASRLQKALKWPPACTQYAILGQLVADGHAAQLQYAQQTVLSANQNNKLAHRGNCLRMVRLGLLDGTFPRLIGVHQSPTMEGSSTDDPSVIAESPGTRSARETHVVATERVRMLGDQHRAHAAQAAQVKEEYADVLRKKYGPSHQDAARQYVERLKVRMSHILKQWSLYEKASKEADRELTAAAKAYASAREADRSRAAPGVANDTAIAATTADEHPAGRAQADADSAAEGAHAEADIHDEEGMGAPTSEDELEEDEESEHGDCEEDDVDDALPDDEEVVDGDDN
jgi:hypothetical protein